MLSEISLGKLREACQISNRAYEHGGLEFRYSVSTSYLMTLRTRSRISKLRAEDNTEFYPDEIEVLEQFFELAMVPDGTDRISGHVKTFVASFVQCLYQDFAAGLKCLLEPDDSELTSELALLILENGLYHEVRLSWSPS